MHWPKFITARYVWIVGLLLIFIGEGFYLSDFKFSRELSLVDIATGLLTLFLGFYIPHRIEKSINSQRFELESLIEDVRRIQADLTLILETVQYSSQPVTQEENNRIIRAFENASLGLQSLLVLALDSKLDQVVIAVNDLERMRRTYKRAVTGGGFQGQYFVFTPAQVQSITTQYYLTRLDCSKLILLINRI